MSRVTTIITGPDGRVTKVVVRRSGCGCLTTLAVVVVLFGPAAWFGPTGAALAYALMGFVAVIAGAIWLREHVHRTPPAPLPPPLPPPAR